MENVETMRPLTGFQHWLGTNYKTLPTDSGEMTKRARLYLKYLKSTNDANIKSNQKI